MIDRRLAVLLLLLCIACKPAPKEATTATSTAAAGGPKRRAVMVTIESKTQPGDKTFTHSLTISGDKARSSDELDAWRLFDLKEKRVTFVDEATKTYRHEPMASLIQKRRAAAAKLPPVDLPRAQVSATGAEKQFLGVHAAQYLVRLGGYNRELWIATHPQIPPELFAMMVASTPPSDLAAIARGVDEALMNVRGFPLADHAELAYGKAKLVIDRNVTKVEQVEVGQNVLEIPRDYEEVKAPAESRPPASSRPPDRTTRGAGSRPSATGRKNP